MKPKTITLIFALLLLLPGCSGTRPGPALVFNFPLNAYVHEPSGFSFPPAIGGFRRDEGILFYDATGNNFSVPYSLITPEEKAVATVYVYPSLRDPAITPAPKPEQTPDFPYKGNYDEAKISIINTYKARVLFEGEYWIIRPSLNLKGMKCTFEFATAGGEKAFYHLYLFAHKGWLVKYRFTYADKYDTVIEPEIKKFIGAFEWP